MSIVDDGRLVLSLWQVCRYHDVGGRYVCLQTLGLLAIICVVSLLGHS